MDLKDFISTTLISIKEGLEEANKKTNQSFKINPEQKVVEFDIAVEVAQEKSNQKGGGLAVKVVEGKIGSSKTSKESNMSRIKFTVGVNTIIK